MFTVCPKESCFVFPVPYGEDRPPSFPDVVFLQLLLLFWLEVPLSTPCPANLALLLDYISLQVGPLAIVISWGEATLLRTLLGGRFGFFLYVSYVFH